MSIKWAFGAVVAVLSAILVLPGVAAAHHNEIIGSIECDDGTWEIHANYYGGDGNSVIVVMLEDNAYDIDSADLSGNDAGSPANQAAIDEDWADLGVNTTLSPDVELDNNTADDDFNFSPGRDRFESDGHGGPADATDQLDSFIAVDGTYQDVDDRPDDDFQFETWLYDANSDQVLDNNIGPNSDFENDGDFYSDFGDYDNYVLSTADFWSQCGGEYCVDGALGVEQLSFQSTATNDCGPVRLCVDGESITVTEFTAESLDGEEGSCVPSEEPPPPPPTTEEEPEEPVEEVEEAVAEVSPAVEEVAALPAAGYGTTADSGIAWIAILGLVLIGFGGGATVLVNRRG